MHIELHHVFKTPLVIRIEAGEWITGVLHNVAINLEKIMSKITEFTDQLNTFFAKQGEAINGIAADVKSLSDQLTAIQNSPGTLSPEDQASLDAALATAAGLTDRLTAIDALTPPVVPPTA